MLKRVKETLGRFVRDDGGSVGLEKLLIIAAVVLPLLGLLIWYRDDIGRWVGDKWEQYRTPGQADPTNPTPSQGP
jgi:Flp pilus assembly pilin Flp